MKRYTKMFEGFDDEPGHNEKRTWQVLMSFFLTDDLGRITPSKIQPFLDSARRNGIDPKGIRLSTDGHQVPMFELEATPSSFLAMLYDLIELGIMDEDIDDIEGSMETFLKPQAGNDGWEDFKRSL